MSNAGRINPMTTVETQCWPRTQEEEEGTGEEEEIRIKRKGIVIDHGGWHLRMGRCIGEEDRVPTMRGDMPKAGKWNYTRSRNWMPWVGGWPT
jgi:hypothetical protein